MRDFEQDKKDFAEQIEKLRIQIIQLQGALAYIELLQKDTP